MVCDGGNAPAGGGLDARVVVVQPIAERLGRTLLTGDGRRFSGGLNDRMKEEDRRFEEVGRRAAILILDGTVKMLLIYFSFF